MRFARSSCYRRRLRPCIPCKHDNSIYNKDLKPKFSTIYTYLLLLYEKSSLLKMDFIDAVKRGLANSWE